MERLICDKCGSDIPMGSRFCPQCADPVTEADCVKDASTSVRVASHTTESAASQLSTSGPIQLVCPKCRKHDTYARNLSQASEELTCPSCRCTFRSRVAKVRAKKSRGKKKEGTRSFTIRIVLFSGGEDIIEFVNASYDDLELRSKDLVAFNYFKGQLRIVQNLTVGRHLVISKPGCYLATMVYGVNSHEVIALRRFRDEVLLQHSVTVVLIKIYYLTSPWVVRWIGSWKTLRRLTRACLDPVARALKE